MNTEIKSLVFSFECHKDWKTLTLTDDTAVRFCDECNKNVYNCNSVDALTEAVYFERCVRFKSLHDAFPKMGFVDPDWYFEHMVAEIQKKRIVASI